MAIDKDLYDTMKQVFMDLVVPRLEELKADIRRLEKQLETRRSLSSRHDVRDASLRPLSPTGRAYMDALAEEVHKDTEREAKKWARQRAKDPKTRIWPK
jgi:hypothetical protein